MNFYERLSELAFEHKKSLNQIEKDLNYGKNTLYAYKRQNPNQKRLLELAEYFEVSVDYLLGQTDERNPKVDLQKVAEDENWDQWLSYGGKPLTENDKKHIREYLRNQHND